MSIQTYKNFYYLISSGSFGSHLKRTILYNYSTQTSLFSPKIGIQINTLLKKKMGSQYASESFCIQTIWVLDCIMAVYGFYFKPRLNHAQFTKIINIVILFHLSAVNKRIIKNNNFVVDVRYFRWYYNIYIYIYTHCTHGCGSVK